MRTDRNESLDLMKLGIGNFAGNETTGYYQVTEHIIALAIRRYFEVYPERRVAEYHQAVDAFQSLVAEHGPNIPGRGNLFETIVFQSLLRSDFQNVPVGTLPFVLPFVGPNDVGKWWMTTSYHAEHVIYHHTLQESTAAFLSSEQAIGVVFSPETVARFDAALRLDANHAMVFAITIWTGSVPDEKVESQIQSTDLSKAYFLADGSRVNKNCKPQRNEWVSLALDRVKAVRVHLYHCTATSRYPQPRMHRMKFLSI